MAYQPDRPVEMAPLILPMTRPTLVFGVPRGAFVLQGMVVAMIFLQAHNPLYLLLALPIHGILYLLTIRDPRFVDILAVKFKKCLPTPNKSFWGGNSYSPDKLGRGRG